MVVELAEKMGEMKVARKVEMLAAKMIEMLASMMVAQ